MQQLRERGIYTLPEGGEFVAHAVFRGGYVLYTPVHSFLAIDAAALHCSRQSTRAGCAVTAFH
jgi:hypothetical protein